MDIVLLRFDAPLMSFGAPIVDNRGVIQPYPALSMMAGLLGNALGYDHSEDEALTSLQRRLRYAVRQDRSGERIRDYQTVDFSKEYMDDSRAWTTRGELETRKGGSASTGTHIRLRDYWADAAYTVALTLDPSDQQPMVGEICDALRSPERPLFIGRKTCLPASSLYLGRVERNGLVEALADLEVAPLADRPDSSTSCTAWWESNADGDRGPREVSEDMRQPVTDRRDWVNQIHVGQRWIARGQISLHSENSSV